MKIDMSPAEIGVIVHSIEAFYSEDSEEFMIANRLCDLVFNELGSEFYDCWIEEFDI